MSWSVVLTTLREVTEENVSNARKRTERAAQKKSAAEEGNSEKKQDAGDVSGGVLGVKPLNAAEAQKAKQVLHRQFIGLISSQNSWLPLVLRDAKQFGASHSGRSNDIVERYLVSSPSKKKQAPQGKAALFAQNLWPQLKSRGWKVEQVNVGGQMSSKYSYAGETVSIAPLL
jgi:hypothetical protein